MKGSKENPKKAKEKIAQNTPARTTVVNFGVSGFHLIVTVYSANAVADKKPNNAPKAVPEILSFTIITQTPIKAITIEIRVERLRISPNKK